MATGDSFSTLYGSKYGVEYKDSNHRYYVDGKQVQSVTTILTQAIAKPDLLLWPLNLALKHLSEKLPNIITKEDIDFARQEHVRKREQGAKTGTAVHALVEKRLQHSLRKDVDIDNLPADVIMAYLAFENWYKQERPNVVSVEQVVYSPTLRYVGTYDSILEINGKVCLCDLKTSNPSRPAPKGIYAEHFVQLGAYYCAYEEQRQFEIENGGTKLREVEDLVVISAKKNGVLDTLALSELGLMVPKDAAEIWWKTLAAYRHLTDLKKRIAGGIP